MKRLSILAGLAAAACGPSVPVEDPSAQRQLVVDLVRQGSGEACTNPATISVIKDVVYGGQSGAPDLSVDQWPQEQAEAFRTGLSSGVELVTLAGVDIPTSRVDCSGRFFANWEGDGGAAPISYSIQPSLDGDGDIVVTVNDVDGPRDAYRMAFSRYFRTRVLPVLVANEEAETRADQRSEGVAMCRRFQQDGYSPDMRPDPWLEYAKEPITPEERATYACIQRVSRAGTAYREQKSANEARAFHEGRARTMTDSANAVCALLRADGSLSVRDFNRALQLRNSLRGVADDPEEIAALECMDEAAQVAPRPE